MSGWNPEVTVELKDVILVPGKPFLLKGDEAMIQDMVESGCVRTQAAFVKEGFPPSLEVAPCCSVYDIKK